MPCRHLPAFYHTSFHISFHELSKMATTSKSEKPSPRADIEDIEKGRRSRNAKMGVDKKTRKSSSSSTNLVYVVMIAINVAWVIIPFFIREYAPISFTDRMAVVAVVSMALNALNMVILTLTRPANRDPNDKRFVYGMISMFAAVCSITWPAFIFDGMFGWRRGAFVCKRFIY